MSTDRDPNEVTERWACMGLRETVGNKLATLWQPPTGNPLLFKIKGVAGALYDVDVSRTDDKTTIHGRPRYIGPMDDAQTRREWATIETGVLVTRERASLEKKRGTELTDACGPLRTMMASCRTRNERRALIAAILAEIGVS